MTQNIQQCKMKEICADKNSIPLQNGNIMDNQGLLYTEDGPPENDTSDKDDSPNETETLGENGNAEASSKQKGKRKRRNRSEKQKERVRQYKKKKRKEKIELQGNTDVNEVSGVIRAEPGSNMSQKSISGIYLLSNSVMWNSGQGTLPTSEITMPAVSTRSGIISTLRVSANIFVPRVSTPASLSQKTELVSNLRASAEPFVPVAKPNVESEPPVRASAEIFVPTQSTGLGKLEQSDSSSSCSEDISKLPKAKPLESHTAIAAPAISALPSVKEPADMEALVDLDVPFDKAPIAAVVSIDSDVPSTETRTNTVASTDSDVQSPKSPADTIASVDSAIMSSEASSASVDCKDSDVMSTKAPTTYVDPADSKVPLVSIRQEQASILISSSDAGNSKPESQLQIPSDTIVPFEETSSEIPEPHCIQHDDAMLSKKIFDNACDDEDDMFSILATYAQSSLHCEIDEIVMSRKQMTEDDFGYTYFSISNFLK